MKKRTLAFAIALIFLLSACNLPGSTGGNTTDPAAATAAQETRIAQMVAQTLAAAVSDTPEFTLTPSDTPLPTFTLTPSDTPPPTFTFTPTVPMVSVSVETNCRTGPGTAYDIVGVLHVGETAEVVGQVSGGGSWIIRNPDGAGFCWLWAQYATVTGNWQALPVFDIPPTPTPMPGFSISYLGMINCGGDYAFRFELKNTGSVTWQSIKINITDSVTATTETHTSDTFKDYPGCVLTNTLQDLEPNEVGVASNVLGAFAYNPTGHNMTATFTLYAQNGLTGQSTTRTISFTP